MTIPETADCPRQGSLRHVIFRPTIHQTRNVAVPSREIPRLDEWNSNEAAKAASLRGVPDLTTVLGADAVKIRTNAGSVGYVADAASIRADETRAARMFSAALSSSTVFRDPGLDQFLDQGGRQGLVRREADGPLAGVVALEIILVGCHRGTAQRIEGAVL